MGQRQTKKYFILNCTLKMATVGTNDKRKNEIEEEEEKWWTIFSVDFLYSKLLFVKSENLKPLLLILFNAFIFKTIQYKAAKTGVIFRPAIHNFHGYDQETIGFKDCQYSRHT